ncbi:unnamed protein product, partial [Phaeothamnion confervicola]
MAMVTATAVGAAAAAAAAAGANGSWGTNGHSFSNGPRHGLGGCYGAPHHRGGAHHHHHGGGGNGGDAAGGNAGGATVGGGPRRHPLERRREVFGDRPVVLLMGGGMGAGKSSLLQEIVNSRFWREFGSDAVVIEADRIKMAAPVFLALRKAELTGGDPGLAQYVHDFSTSAANEALLAAVNHGQDIIMDGTLAWAEYVRQTVEMIREAHLHRHRIGPGYAPGGRNGEKYWERTAERSPEERRRLRPYKIEVVGATCPPELAVARGIRRKLLIGRGVPVAQQLRSHRLFAEHFAEYAALVDEASLFDTTADDRPRLLAHKVEGRPLLLEPLPYADFYRRRQLREDASNVEELFPSGAASAPLAHGSGSGARGGGGGGGRGGGLGGFGGPGGGSGAAGVPLGGYDGDGAAAAAAA